MDNDVIKKPSFHQGFKPLIQTSLFSSADHFSWKDFKYDTLPCASASFDVGGDNQEERNLLEFDEVKLVEHNILPIEGRSVKGNYDLKSKSVRYTQFNEDFFDESNILDPKETTFEDLREHALVVQELAEETVNSAFRLWRKMDEHPISPVNFRHPTPKSFANYMNAVKKFGDYDRYRTKLVPVGKLGLVNRRKAWNICTAAWGVDGIWPKYKIKKIPDRTRDLKIPTPETVHAMLTHKYVKDRDFNRMIQYHFFFGFMIGMAPEKEFVIMNLDDVTIDEHGNNLMRITRPKVNSNTRILKLEPTIATSKVHKSVKNYLDYTRPKFAEEGEEAFFINPRSGRRWTSKSLREFLSKHGKIVYEPFFPYLMRHWCGTARMIEWGSKDKAFSMVNYWLGHKELDQTKTYVEFSHLFHDDNGSWLSRALKHGSRGGLHGSDEMLEMFNKSKKRALLNNSSPVEFSGSAGI